MEEDEYIKNALIIYGLLFVIIAVGCITYVLAGKSIGIVVTIIMFIVGICIVLGVIKIDLQ